jgi:hypothetical protein
VARDGLLRVRQRIVRSGTIARRYEIVIEQRDDTIVIERQRARDDERRIANVVDDDSARFRTHQRHRAHTAADAHRQSCVWQIKSYL